MSTPFVAASRTDLAPFDILSFPVWVLDVERRAVWWANRAALELWEVDGLDALAGWDSGADRFRRGETVIEQHPCADGIRAVAWTCSVLAIEEGRPAMLVQGNAYVVGRADATALRAAEALRESEWKYRSVINNTREGFWMLDAAGRTVEVNEALCRLLGYGPDEMLGRSPLEFVDTANRAIFTAQMAGIPSTEHRRYDIALRHREGHNIPARFNTTTLWNDDGTVYGAFAFVSDLTEQRRAEAMLTRLSSATEHSGSAILILDGDGTVQYVNARFTEMAGFSAAEVLGRRFQTLRATQTPAMEEIAKALAARRGWRGKARNLRRDGSEYWAFISVNPVTVENGARTDFVVVCEDVTALVEAQARAERLCFFDPLTGLANRRLFADRLDRAIRTALRERTAAALMFLDLDRFKEINDTLGHGCGDQVLEAVAARLTAAVRDEDTVSRLGGDEFTVILRRVDGERGVAVVAEKLLRALAEPVDLACQRVVVGSSIGIAMIPSDGDEVEILMRNADRAMYQAKAAARGTYRFYSPSMDAQVGHRIRLEQELRAARDGEQFVLHFQPLVCLATGRITALEALLRWQHPTRGLILPDEFIPVAEETGLIIPIGAWVLHSACRYLQAFHAPGSAGFGVSVNISSRQFRDGNLLATVQSAIEQSGIAPNHLELELTESAVMDDPEAAIATLNALKALGVTIAVDDFGTGHSSLASLKRLPIDTLKIDRSFIRDIPANGNDLAITSAIIAMAHRLGLAVVAEGVETAPQREFLRRSACETGQGFLFSSALPPDQVAGFLLARH